MTCNYYSSGELRRRLIDSIRAAQRHSHRPGLLHSCLQTSPYRYMAVSPSLIAFYTHLLQRRRELVATTASFAGRSQSPVVSSSATSSLHCSPSSHLPAVPPVPDDVEYNEVSSMCLAATSSTVNDSSTSTLRQLAAVNRYHPYDKTI